MSQEIARSLYETGRAHALSSQLLYQASLEYAHSENLPDPQHFAFNGTYSLSVFSLLGLGLELFLKAAIVLHDDDADYKYLKNTIGHDLVAALDAAEANGFVTNAPNVREFVEVLREPYIAHYFRYERPAQMPLPDIAQAMEIFAILDDEFEDAFGILDQAQ